MLPRQHIWRYQVPRHTLCHYGYVTHGATRVTLQVAPAGGVVLLSIFILHHLAPSFRHCDSLYIILYTYIFIVLLLMFMYDLVFFFLIYDYLNVHAINTEPARATQREKNKYKRCPSFLLQISNNLFKLIMKKKLKNKAAPCLMCL